MFVYRARLYNSYVFLGIIGYTKNIFETLEDDKNATTDVEKRAEGTAGRY
jgi:hypothetical protein